MASLCQHRLVLGARVLGVLAKLLPVLHRLRGLMPRRRLRDNALSSSASLHTASLSCALTAAFSEGAV